MGDVIEFRRPPPRQQEPVVKQVTDNKHALKIIKTIVQAIKDDRLCHLSLIMLEKNKKRDSQKLHTFIQTDVRNPLPNNYEMLNKMNAHIEYIEDLMFDAFDS